MHRYKILFLGACVTALSHITEAATITQYNRSTFQSAVASSTLSGQNFDSLPLGTITTVSGVTYTPSLGTALVTSTYLTTTSPNGLGSTSSGYFQPNETLTIAFAAPITAFALDINTFAPTAGAYRLTLNDSAGSTVSSVFDVFPAYTTGQFLGFTDSAAFTRVTLAAVSGYSYTVDTLAYGSAAALPSSVTPEPSSLALLATGLVGAAAAMRRRVRL